MAELVLRNRVIPAVINPVPPPVQDNELDPDNIEIPEHDEQVPIIMAEANPDANVVDQNPVPPVAPQPQVPPVAPPPQLAAIRPLRPNSFDGSISQAAAWLRNVRRYFIATDLPNGQKAIAFPLYLTGPAEFWYTNLPVATKQNYDALIEAFEQQYVNAPHLTMLRQMSAFNTLQTPNQAVQDYVDQMLPTLYALNLPEQTIISIICQNLRPELRTLALQHMPYNNFQEFLSKLRNYELSFKQTYGQTSHLAAVITANEDNARIEKLEEEMRNLTTKDKPDRSRSMERDRHNNNRQRSYSTSPYRRRRSISNSRSRERQKERDTNCWSCGSYNHFQRDCSNRRRVRFQDDYSRPRNTSPPWRTYDNRYGNRFNTRRPYQTDYSRNGRRPPNWGSRSPQRGNYGNFRGGRPFYRRYSSPRFPHELN